MSRKFTPRAFMSRNVLPTASVLGLVTALGGGVGISGAAFAGGDAPKFYSVEAFSVTYEHSGAETGQTVQHSRAWGRERVEVKDTSMSMFGVNQTTDQRVIYLDDQIISIDGATGRTTKTTNPLYADIVASMEGKSGMEAGAAWMTGLGGEKTGESKSLLGETCSVWSIPKMFATQCITDAGIPLEISVAMPGMGMTMVQTAIELSLGEPGPDAAYEYDEAAVQSSPAPGVPAGMPEGFTMPDLPEGVTIPGFPAGQ